MCIKSEFKEICLKLATNGRSDKGFLLTSKVCPQGVFCPCPGAIYMYKIIKNVYKIRLWRDHFETCNIWAKRKGLSVVIKILSPMDWLSAPARGFMLTSTFVPKGLSAPILGLYTCIKALNYIPGPGVRWAFTGPLVLWFSFYHFLSSSEGIHLKLTVIITLGRIDLTNLYAVACGMHAHTWSPGMKIYCCAISSTIWWPSKSLSWH